MISKIEWTDRSDWNPVRGCTRVSRGCGGPGEQGGCYAEAMAARFSKPGMWGHGFAEMVGGRPRWTGKAELIDEKLLKPLSWRKPGFVFPNSTSDFFHEKLSDADRDKIFAVMALCPHLIFQIPTKRPEIMRRYCSALVPKLAILGDDRSLDFAKAMFEICDRAGRKVPGFVPFPLPNVWLGVSTEDQAAADERIPLLLETPAALRFISAEPLLGPIDLTAIPVPNDHAGKYAGHGYTFNALQREDDLKLFNAPAHLDWIIAGGESGPRARPMHPAWPRQLRDQCKAYGVRFFFKQWGAYQLRENFPGTIEAGSPQTIAWPDGSIGPGRAAVNGGLGETLDRVRRTEEEHRRLDGREHSEFPAVDEAAAA